MPTTPPTFVAGDILEADQLNLLGDGIVELQAVAEAIPFTGCQIYRTSAQSIANSSDVEVTWQAEDYDIGGWFTSGTDIVVPAGAIPAGYTTIVLNVRARCRFVDNGTGSRSIQGQLNGAQFAGNAAKADSGETTEVWIDDDVVVEAADVITIVVRQSSGGSLDMDSAKVNVRRQGPLA